MIKIKLASATSEKVTIFSCVNSVINKLFKYTIMAMTHF